MGNTAENLYTNQFYTRNQFRWKLIYFLRLFDSKTNTILGHLADVTEEGFLMLSEHILPVQKQYSLKLEILDDSDEEIHVEFSARSVWSKKDTLKEFYETGFKLINPSEETKNAISMLIAQLKSSS